MINFQYFSKDHKIMRGPKASGMNTQNMEKIHKQLNRKKKC